MSTHIDFTAKTLQPSAQWPVLVQRSQEVPHAASFQLQRFDALSLPGQEEGGLFLYQPLACATQTARIEIRFVLTGLQVMADGLQKPVPALDFVQLCFPATYLHSIASGSPSHHLQDAILRMQEPLAFAQHFTLNAGLRRCLEALVQPGFEGVMGNIYTNAMLQSLLVLSLNGLHPTSPRQPAFQCKFLADQHGHDRILAARDVLLQHIGSPITIKELSRKVAINECYLKKGFKEVFGTTIFDFYQQQRMEHAKFLLHERGLSVTNVADELGYSSISHFSAAFKRHTGLKPCELLR